MQRITSRIWSAYAFPFALFGLAACSSGDAPKAALLPDGAVAPDDGSSSSAGTSGGSMSSDGGIVSTTFIPMFPGAGTGNASDPLVGGKLCDYVPHAGEKGAKEPLTECFFEPGKTKPAATLEQVLECVEGADTVHLRLTFDPAFVDNTFGANAIGWEARMKMGGKMPKPGDVPKAPHSWKDLVGSDHAELIVTNAAGEKALHFSLDYISEDASSPTGYSSLGPNGGDGEIFEGDAGAIVKWSTSIDRNFNERGYDEYTVDSPATDADYTPNAAAPEWDFRVVYEAWIDVAAFGASGFGDATIEYVHASPSKFPENTIEVVPGECPPDWCTDPDGCDGGGSEPPNDACVVGGPDDSCYDGSTGLDGGGPDFCKQNPNDPRCSAE